MDQSVWVVVHDPCLIHQMENHLLEMMNCTLVTTVTPWILALVPSTTTIICTTTVPETVTIILIIPCYQPRCFIHNSTTVDQIPADKCWMMLSKDVVIRQFHSESPTIMQLCGDHIENYFKCTFLVPHYTYFHALYIISSIGNLTVNNGVAVYCGKISAVLFATWGKWNRLYSTIFTII